MNDLELLKEFRAGLGTEPGDADIEAAWVVLRSRLGNGPVVRRRHARRWAAAVAVAAAVVALVFAVPAILPLGAPGGARRASAAVSFTNEGGYIIAVFEDPLADSEALKAAFAEHGLDITVQLEPVSPSLVGQVVWEGIDESNQSSVEVLYSDQGNCTHPGGGMRCLIGLKIPVDFRGHADFGIGRAAQPGEDYSGVNDAFAPGEVLHCSGLYGMTVEQALPALDRLGVTAVWRSYDRSLDGDGKGIDPSLISDQFVLDAAPKSPNEVYIWVTPDQPPPQPLDEYTAAVNKGC